VGEDKGEGETLLGKIYKEMLFLCQDGKASSLQALMPGLGMEAAIANSY
jgi:hypothetical protein